MVVATVIIELFAYCKFSKTLSTNRKKYNQNLNLCLPVNQRKTYKNTLTNFVKGGSLLQFQLLENYFYCIFLLKIMISLFKFLDYFLF